MKTLLLPFSLLLIIAFISLNCENDNEPTEPNTPPSVPTLLSPVNGATNVSVPSIFTWHTSKGTTSYALQVSLSSSFTSFVYNESGLLDTIQQISGLSYSTTYNWRVNAANSKRTSEWSTPTWSFTTKSGGGSPCVGVPTFSYDGKIYHSVQIGSQCWLKENLSVGKQIGGIQYATNNGIIEKYCYNNDPANCNTYGGLYRWDEAMQYTTIEGTRGICPMGWHIPTEAEFQRLINTVGGDDDALKAVGQATGTNTSGFSGLLTGESYYQGGNNYTGLGDYTRFSSSTVSGRYTAYYMYLDYGTVGVQSLSRLDAGGNSIRCIKD